MTAGHDRVDTDQRSASLFPTFFLAGFECSTFLWKDGQRKDYIALTGHDRCLEEDYAFLKNLGISVVREGVPWPFVDPGGGRYDFSFLDEALDGARECRIMPIWDLCHYGFPDGCDPFDERCVRRFIEYCQAVAERVRRVLPPPHFFTPVNEISFFASAGTLNAGVDLQGVCLYPAVDIPDWNSGEWAHIGLCDVDTRHDLARRPVPEYVAELRRWQRLLGQPENIDPGQEGAGDDDGCQADLREMRALARRWAGGEGAEIQAELEREEQDRFIL